MVIVTVVNAGPTFFLERCLPTVSTFIEPLVHALAHVYAFVLASGQRKQDEEQVHDRYPISRYRKINSCFAAFGASSVGGRGAPARLVPA